VTFSSAGTGEAVAVGDAFASSTLYSVNEALMDRLIHVATANETNKNAKKECAANHNAKHTATNQAGDLIALKTNCFGIFLSRKTDAQGGCPAGTALDGFRCSIEQGKTARGETLSSRLDKAWRKHQCGGRKIEQSRYQSRCFSSMRPGRGDEIEFTRTGQAHAGESSQKQTVFRRGVPLNPHCAP
jgi:hypothetical protein